MLARKADPRKGHRIVAAIALATTLSTSCAIESWSSMPEGQDAEAFPMEAHSLLPPENGERVSVGIDKQAVDSQPIAFDHSIHAGSVDSGGMAMDCQYCHSSARRSIHAGVPALEVCMNCHKMVDDSDRPELQKIKEYWAKGESPPWIKVHDLPDFVHFSHAPHVRGGVECQECHGAMETRTVAERDEDMTMLMGWCLDCHENHPSVDENYSAEAPLRRVELKDCYNCHR